MRAIVVVLAVILIFSLPAGANVVKVSLDGAIDLALENNLDL